MNLRGPNSGPSLTLQQIPTVAMKQVQLVDLSNEEREVYSRAIELWEQNQHITVNLPLPILQGVINERMAGAKTPAEGLAQLTALKEEFAFIKPEEMAEIEPDEKVGVLRGDFIFVSDDTPEDFVPLVVLNLALLRHLKDSNPVSQMLTESGIDIDESRHWSANVLDIFLAEKFFEGDPQKFAEFMAWRKKMEQTGFFRNFIIDDLLRKKSAVTSYRRNTLPMDRGLYARHSWRTASCLKSMSRRKGDMIYRDLKVAKSDMILQRVVESPKFDPAKMVELIDYIATFAKSGGKSYETKWSVDIKDPALAKQAYLLSEDEVGEPGVIKSQTGNTFELKRQWQVTLEAVKNNIICFYGHTLRKLLNESPAKDAILPLFQKTGSLIAAGTERGKTQVVTDIRDTEKMISSKKELESESSDLSQKLAGMRDVLNKLNELEQRLKGSCGEAAMPSVIDQKRMELKAVSDEIAARLAEVKQLSEVLTELQKTIWECNTLIQAIDLEPPEKIQALAS